MFTYNTIGIFLEENFAHRKRRENFGKGKAGPSEKGVT